MDDAALTWLLSVGWTVLIPVGVGVGTARWGGTRTMVALAVIAVVSSLTIPAMPPWSQVVPSVGIAGLAHGLAIVEPPVRWKVLGAIALFLGLSEAGTRGVLPEPSGVYRSGYPPWVSVQARQGDAGDAAIPRAACALAFDDPDPPTGPWVLHLGDSMVRGIDPPGGPGAPFRAAWRAQRPDRAHITRAALGTSADVQLLGLRKALPHRPDAVFWYVFAGNDLAEFGRGWPCCDGASLLVEDTTTARCTTPRWRAPGWWARQRQVADHPWLWVQAAPGSRLAQWAMAAWTAVLHHDDLRDNTPPDTVAHAIAAGVEAAQQAGVPIRVVWMPDGARPPVDHPLRNALDRAGLGDVLIVPPFPTDPTAHAALLTGDGVHFNADGLRTLVDGVRPALDAIVPGP